MCQQTGGARWPPLLPLLFLNTPPPVFHQENALAAHAAHLELGMTMLSVVHMNAYIPIHALTHTYLTH